MKFLIVDDDFISRTKMQAILEEFGECVLAENGEEALDAFNASYTSESPFNLMTLDISMPGMNGDEVLQQIRETELKENIKDEDKLRIIMVTSHADKDYIVTCLQAGCTDYIVKPFTMETVKKKIDDIKLSEKPEVEELAEANEFKSLVIDDDFISRTKMHTILDTLGTAVDIDNGREAIELFKQAIEKKSPFDLITLDIEMPGMDGTEVLINFREIETENKIPDDKKAIILMVTSHSDKDTFITCRQAGCNDYIVKPFDEKSISTKLQEIKSTKYFDFSDKNSSQMTHNIPTINSIIEDITTALKNDDINLPSFPKTSLKLKKLVEKGAELQEIEDLLRLDIGIASKLISISNAVFYQGVFINKTLTQALSRLGIETAQQIVDAICHRSMYDKANQKFAVVVDKLWKHSISCAYASQFIAEHLKIKSKDDPFTLGLFHDIGKLMLLQIIDEMEKRGAFGQVVEKETFFGTLDKFHGQFGAALLKKWGFSDGFTEIVMHHNNIEAVPSADVALRIVHFANLLAKKMESGESAMNLNILASTKFATDLGLNFEIVGEIARQITESIAIEF